MRLIFFVAASLFSFTSLSAASGPHSLYGDKIAFDVMRSGTVVGQHITRFREEEDTLVVTSETKIDISFLFVPLYEFDYRAVEKWQEEKLISLDINFSDGGDKTAFNVRREGDVLKVKKEGLSIDMQGDIISTNHWNSNVLRDQKVLNSLTGNLNAVTIKEIGKEEIQVTEGTLAATRYDYSGDLRDISVWYDDKGRWVKLRFKAKDGSIIDYRCRTCMLPQHS